MLAAHRDQENVYIHQAGNSKQQAKTPGARFPKTPLKVPLNDENTNHGFGGKSVLQTKGNKENNLTVGKGGNGLGKPGKQALMTPAAPQTGRAPLGNKTTNAKARTAQNTNGGKETVKPTPARRLKQAAPQNEAPKLQVHTDKIPLADEEEIEYAPPRPQERPYESDILPEGVLTFEGLKPENLFKGYYQYYFNRLDDNGKTAIERDMEDRQQKKFKQGEEQILKDMEEFDWSIGDIPESKDVFKKKNDTVKVEVKPGKQVKPVVGFVRKQPSTLTARKAASALAMPKSSLRASGLKTKRTLSSIGPSKTQSRGFMTSKQQPLQPPITLPIRDRAAPVAASRSTLGYSKGRSASTAINGNTDPTTAAARAPEIVALKDQVQSRSVSTMSSGSDATITPARFAKEAMDWKKPDFLSIFDTDDVEEDDDTNLGGGSAPPLDDDDETFQFATYF
ncbi:hypothetical protein QBC38DRAFT_40720 [Podospora fimiseda]|uniref:Uncharacterized protein n=1 Tax=Podospora fimiseda TaxID=252190 RepID=A0AAN7H417_9PEZI|nr:hypothetical protein QBC38DRAFT_40720 [Podospora fimiseda]